MKTLSVETIKSLYKDFDKLLYEYDIIEAQDIFRILNAYQSSKLDNIENANNETHRVALGRTVLYHNTDVIDQFNKTKSLKKKEQMIIKIVNLFVLDIPEEKYIYVSGISTRMYNIIVAYKDSILKSESWYLRVVPESKWLISHLKLIGKK